MNDVYISYFEIEEPSWSKKYLKFCRKILKYLNKSNWELSVLFCNDEYIKKLNNDYRNKNEATDVLSFCQEEISSDENKKYSAGDIVISLDTLKKNSEYFNVSENEELKRLTIHGILHLAGLDHEDNSPEREMLIYQEEILGFFKGVKIIRK